MVDSSAGRKAIVALLVRVWQHFNLLRGRVRSASKQRNSKPKKSLAGIRSSRELPQSDPLHYGLAGWRTHDPSAVGWR